MSNFKTQLKRGFVAGVKKGWSTFLWMCKIVIPISFVLAILQWTGWLNELDFLLNPLMGVLNLPGEAAFPIIIGLLVGTYGAIAAMIITHMLILLIRATDELPPGWKIIPYITLPTSYLASRTVFFFFPADFTYSVSLLVMIFSTIFVTYILLRHKTNKFKTTKHIKSFKKKDKKKKKQKKDEKDE